MLPCDLSDICRSKLHAKEVGAECMGGGGVGVYVHCRCKALQLELSASRIRVGLERVCCLCGLF